MGQGYSMTTISAASANVDIPELSDLTQDKTLASARFMKSVRARSHQGYVFIKAVMKPYSSFDVRTYVSQLTEERNVLAKIPNALAYQRIVETGTAGFLVRQYVYSSVYDRLSTRPFLEDIEKRWLSFQLLCAVRDCHAENLYHGDIKTENLLVTSWNWLYLSDFSSCFKPTMLPADNPADFSFYFDTSARRVCYIAPERFSDGTHDDSGPQLNWAMDMFSVGCAIAEIFLEGPIFSLSQIFKYRTGEYNPEHAHLSRIEDPEIRAMILNMIDLDPEKRYSAEQHLNFYRAKIFPEYFYDFLHHYMEDLTEPISNDSLSLSPEILVESDRKIDRVYHDFDKIAVRLGYNDASLSPAGPHDGLNSKSHNVKDETLAGLVNPTHDGTLLFLTIISAAVRNAAKSSARLKACDLLALFAHRLPDEAKLDRVLPFVVSMFNDKSDAVKVAALLSATSIMRSIAVVSPINAYLFPEYIFPKLKMFTATGQNQPSAIVRAAYASCLADLALASSRMLDMVQAIRADGRVPALTNDSHGPDTSYHALYDVARSELVPHFEEATTVLITDPEISVRRALLGSISRLCLFFGSSRSSDVILSHLNTYLNEPDWILRCAFYDALVGIATYVGTSSLEQFVLPIMVGSMADQEHFVVEKVIRSFARMAALGLFQRHLLWSLADLISRYLVHPSSWIREASVQFIEQASKYLTEADKYCIMLPILQPFLRAPLLEFKEDSILEKLKSPLPRPVFDAAVLWASKRERSLFWTAASRDGTFATTQAETPLFSTNSSKRIAHRIPPSQKDKDDQQSLETLRNLGMVPDDDVKLMALREYILRLAQHKIDSQTEDAQRLLNNIVSLAHLSVTPQNVFFDTVQPYKAAATTSNIQRAGDGETQRTIADALLDASVSLDAEAVHPSDSLNATGRPSQPTPIPKTSTDPRGRVSDPNDTASDPVDRPNIRIEGLKGSNTHRASSVAGRHALLDPDRLSTSRRDSAQVRHRHSATNLKQRSETMKAGAEISTIQENVFGKIDRSASEPLSNQQSILSNSLNADDEVKSRSSTPRGVITNIEANHSYAGNEPAVMRLLDNHLAENFPVDLLDFGKSAISLENELLPIKSASSAAPYVSRNEPPTVSGNRDTWRPSGLLLVQLVEHTAAINRIVASSDHTFFVTASDDGTCKIWDTSRLEKNVSARSRYTYRHAHGTKVKSLCFVQDTNTFVSGATDGSVHAVRVEVKAVDGSQAPKFVRPVLARDWQIPQQTPLPASGQTEENHDNLLEHAVWMHHYRGHNSQSVLLVATNLCRIFMLDLKNMEIIRVMHNPLHHGTPVSFCIDRKHHWMMVGTSHGVLDLWDLRFKLRLRSIGVGGAGRGKRVDKVLLHPSRGHGKWVVVSCGGEISVWDIEKETCREVLRPVSFKLDPIRRIKNYDPWFPDEDATQAIIERDPLTSMGGNDVNTPDTSNSVATSSQTQVPSIMSITIFNDYLANEAHPDNPNKAALMLSVGEDRVVRYWNLGSIDKSFIVSGPMINVVGEENKIKSRYETSWPTSMSLSGLVQLVEEKLSDVGTEDSTSTAANQKGQARKKKDNASRTGKGAAESSRNAKTPRNALISQAQEQMLKTHVDDILDVCLLRKPYGCIVTVDRGGAILVFH